MYLPILCVLSLVLSPQEQRPNLVLPAPAPRPAKPEQPVESEADRFLRDALRLRRSVTQTPATEEAVLREIGDRWRDAGAMAARLARQADPDLLQGLAKLLYRYGTAKEGAELRSLLLIRPMGAATRDVAQAMVALLKEDAKDALFELMTAGYVGVRAAATELLKPKLSAGDLPRVIALLRERSEDVQQKALELLGALPLPEARSELLQALSSRSPVLAGQAAQSLVEHGETAAADLQVVLRRAAIDRSFGYAAWALTLLEDRTGKTLLDAEMVPRLRAELGGQDPFLSACSALALANLAYRSTDTSGQQFGDADVVEGLLLIVAPRGYVASYAMLLDVAQKKLVTFTGRSLRGVEAWRAWWALAKVGFVGMRARVDLRPEDAGRAVLTWTDERRTIRFRGEQAPAVAAAPDAAATPEAARRAESGRGMEKGRGAENARDARGAEKAAAGATSGERAAAGAKARTRDVQEFVLSAGEMAALLARLEELGFMRPAAEPLPPGIVTPRALELTVGGSRTRMEGPAAPARWFDVFEAEIVAVAERERWQLYTAAGGSGTETPSGGDPLAAWHAERQWLDEHGDRRARQLRLKDHILSALPQRSGAARAQALDHLMAIGDLSALLTEADGLLLLAEVQPGSQHPADVRLLELAVAAPGERVEQRLFELLGAYDDEGGRAVVARVFSLLGSDRVLRAVQTAPLRLRTAAMHEAAALRDTRAVPLLLAAVREQDPLLRENALIALGTMAAPQAREPLLAMLPDLAKEPASRRAAWLALARIGGPGVLEVLVEATTVPDLGDRMAAVQALGKLEDPQAAALLAQIFAAHGMDPLGKMAMAGLREHGPLRARPALRPYLTMAEPMTRQEVVLLLAEFQDPLVVPELITMLAANPDDKRVAFLLSATTGQDLLAQNDRATAARLWYQRNKDVPQAMWYLEGLRRSGIQTSLVPEQLGPRVGSAAVPELTRIMESTDRPHLLVLTAAMLRETTERDFGAVTLETTPARLHAIAERYRYFAEAEQAAGR